MRSRLTARRPGLQRLTQSLWTCFCAPPKSSRWIGPMSPASLELRNSTSGSSAVHIPSLKGGSCLFSAICIAKLTSPKVTLVGSVEQGYTAMPVIEDTLASHLSPSLAPSWKSRPLLPSKLCKTTSALFGKSYIAAGQASMALYTMAILQAYQVDVLKEMDEGTGLTPEAVKELRRATDLALRATKHTARAVGRSMAASVAAERHLWLNLTEIREREKVFLMDAPISQSGLFGEAVSAVVDKFRSAKTQSVALKQFMQRRPRDYSTPSSSVSREQSLPRKEPPSGGAQATRPSPTTVWGARGRSFPRQQPRKRVNLKRPNKPATSANLGLSWPPGRNEESRFMRKRFCLPRTRSPQVNLSQPPFEAWCADLVHPHFYSGWQLGDAFVFPPLQLVHSPPANRMLGDTAVSLLQCTEPVPATRQPSTSLSIILNKDADGSPSRWRVLLLPGLLDTPSQVCLPLHNTLIPLSHFLHEWERLPGVSLWVLRTIRTGYTLQFGNPPPPLWRGSPDSSKQRLQGLCSTTGTFLPPTERSNRGSTAVGSRTRVLQPLLPHSKRDGGLRPILDLRRLNFSLYKGMFKMLMIKTIMSQVQEGNWFVTIDLKDAYFHIKVVQRHRRFLRFAFGGKAYQYKVLPFGLDLAPRTFMKCMDAALAPLRLQGIRVLNYLDDWLILAHSGSLQGANESSQGYRSRPHPFSWPQDERQEKCPPPISANCVSRGSFGFRSDAGPFGSCPDSRSYSVSGPLQARPSCLCRYLPQAFAPHGSGLPCVVPRVASHEAIPLVDEVPPLYQLFALSGCRAVAVDPF